ncbi:MAG: orotate phosphoribosyltransferase [Dethiobacter sp.]|jgi:orotate phosphoribosyltransferase|nr:orotate phosphoribosyltransferase [Dethiobacter sp.]
MLTEDKVLEILKETEVLLEGHFLLTSGKHSDRYLQCARVLQYPHHAAVLCGALAEHFASAKPQLCIGPALGGVIIAYETARSLGVRGIFAERDKDGEMELRRGFNVKPGERVLVLEDVVTTGGSVLEVVNLVKDMGGEVVGVGSIVDRSGGMADFDVPFTSLIKLDAKAFDSADCPLCLQGIPAVKPGSRK